MSSSAWSLPRSKNRWVSGREGKGSPPTVVPGREIKGSSPPLQPSRGFKRSPPSVQPPNESKKPSRPTPEVQPRSTPVHVLWDVDSVPIPDGTAVASILSSLFLLVQRECRGFAASFLAVVASNILSASIRCEFQDNCVSLHEWHPPAACAVPSGSSTPGAARDDKKSDPSTSQKNKEEQEQKKGCLEKKEMREEMELVTFQQASALQLLEHLFAVSFQALRQKRVTLQSSILVCITGNRHLTSALALLRREGMFQKMILIHPSRDALPGSPSSRQPFEALVRTCHRLWSWPSFLSFFESELLQTTQPKIPPKTPLPISADESPHESPLESPLESSLPDKHDVSPISAVPTRLVGKVEPAVVEQCMVVSSWRSDRLAIINKDPKKAQPGETAAAAVLVEDHKPAQVTPPLLVSAPIKFSLMQQSPRRQKQPSASSRTNKVSDHPLTKEPKKAHAGLKISPGEKLSTIIATIRPLLVQKELAPDGNIVPNPLSSPSPVVDSSLLAAGQSSSIPGSPKRSFLDALTRGVEKKAAQSPTEMKVFVAPALTKEQKQPKETKEPSKLSPSSSSPPKKRPTPTPGVKGGSCEKSAKVAQYLKWFKQVMAICSHEKMIPRESVVRSKLQELMLSLSPAKPTVGTEAKPTVGTETKLTSETKAKLKSQKVGPGWVDAEFEEWVKVVTVQRVGVCVGVAPQRLLWPADQPRFECADYFQPQERLTAAEMNKVIEFLSQSSSLSDHVADRGRYGFANFLQTHGPTCLRTMPRGHVVELVQLLLNRNFLLFRKGTVSLRPGAPARWQEILKTLDTPRASPASTPATSPTSSPRLVGAPLSDACFPPPPPLSPIGGSATLVDDSVNKTLVSATITPTAALGIDDAVDVLARFCKEHLRLATEPLYHFEKSGFQHSPIWIAVVTLDLSKVIYPPSFWQSPQATDLQTFEPATELVPFFCPTLFLSSSSSTSPSRKSTLSPRAPTKPVSKKKSPSATSPSGRSETAPLSPIRFRSKTHVKKVDAHDEAAKLALSYLLARMDDAKKETKTPLVPFRMLDDPVLQVDRALLAVEQTEPVYQFEQSGKMWSCALTIFLRPRPWQLALTGAHPFSPNHRFHRGSPNISLRAFGSIVSPPGSTVSPPSSLPSPRGGATDLTTAGSSTVAFPTIRLRATHQTQSMAKRAVAHHLLRHFQQQLGPKHPLLFKDTSSSDKDVSRATGAPLLPISTAPVFLPPLPASAVVVHHPAPAVIHTSSVTPVQSVSPAFDLAAPAFHDTRNATTGPPTVNPVQPSSWPALPWAFPSVSSVPTVAEMPRPDKREPVWSFPDAPVWSYPVAPKSRPTSFFASARMPSIPAPMPSAANRSCHFSESAANFSSLEPSSFAIPAPTVPVPLRTATFFAPGAFSFSSEFRTTDPDEPVAMFTTDGAASWYQHRHSPTLQTFGNLA